MDSQRLQVALGAFGAIAAAVVTVAFGALFATRGPMGFERVVYAGSMVGTSAAAVGFAVVARRVSTGNEDIQLTNSGATVAMLAGSVQVSMLSVEEPWRTLFLGLLAPMLAGGVTMVALSLEPVRRRVRSV